MIKWKGEKKQHKDTFQLHAKFIFYASSFQKIRFPESWKVNWKITQFDWWYITTLENGMPQGQISKRQVIMHNSIWQICHLELQIHKLNFVINSGIISRTAIFGGLFELQLPVMIIKNSKSISPWYGNLFKLLKVHHHLNDSSKNFLFLVLCTSKFQEGHRENDFFVLMETAGPSSYIVVTPTEIHKVP